MTDKQINLLKNLDKNKIFNGDTIQFNFIEKTVKGVCFNQTIYIRDCFWSCMGIKCLT